MKRLGGIGDAFDSFIDGSVIGGDNFSLSNHQGRYRGSEILAKIGAVYSQNGAV